MSKDEFVMAAETYGGKEIANLMADENTSIEPGTTSMKAYTMWIETCDDNKILKFN